MEDAIFKYKPYLFTVGYNLTGDIAIAEDLVQESFEKWLSIDNNDISNPKAYLSKILIHEGFKIMERQKKEKELYKGVWLPEPLISEGSIETGYEAYDPLDYAFICLLERLDPYERAIVVLKEAFDYSYREISELLDVTEVNCRQVLHRSKEKLKSEPKKRKRVEGDEKNLLYAFLQAIQTNDVKSLEKLLLKDVEFYSDGGGKAPTALKPLFGSEKVIKFFIGVTNIQTDLVFTAKFVEANGSPAVIILANGEFNSLMTLVIENGKIAAVYSIRNPDKIKF